jgi:hypothetical protein
LAQSPGSRSSISFSDNLPDALDQDGRDIADGDWPHVPADLRGVKAGQPNQRAGRRLNGPTDLLNIKQSHNRFPDIARPERPL